jgi:sialidase-1
MCSNSPTFFEKKTLFEKKTHGFHHFRIPSLLITKKGTILVACEARRWRSDWATQAIMMKRSEDLGKTWSEMAPLVYLKWPIIGRFKWARNKIKTRCNNPLFIMDSDGITIHFLYILNYSKAFHRTSQDEGKNWSEPVDITEPFENFRRFYNWNVIAIGPGKGIELTKGQFQGRLVAPIWLAFGSGKSHVPNVAGVIYSDDHGKTWQPGDLVPMPENVYNLNESNAVELKDERVVLNIRNESHKKTGRRFRIISFSNDGAHEWSSPQFDAALYEGVCMSSLIRGPKFEYKGENYETLLFSHPISAIPGKRENLTIRISIDEHKNWIFARKIENGPSAYSDLAVAPDDSIYCLYEYSMPNSLHPDDNIAIVHFNMNWIVQDTEND